MYRRSLSGIAPTRIWLFSPAAVARNVTCRRTFPPTSRVSGGGGMCWRRWWWWQRVVRVVLLYTCMSRGHDGMRGGSADAAVIIACHGHNKALCPELSQALDADVRSPLHFCPQEVRSLLIGSPRSRLLPRQAFFFLHHHHHYHLLLFSPLHHQDTSTQCVRLHGIVNVLSPVRRINLHQEGAARPVIRLYKHLAAPPRTQYTIDLARNVFDPCFDLNQRHWSFKSGPLRSPWLAFAIRPFVVIPGPRVDA